LRESGFDLIHLVGAFPVSSNIQLNWLKTAAAAEKPYVAMVVGWQTVRETLNSTVMRFNSKFFDPTNDPHHQMKIIAAKQSVVASLKELLVSIGRWRDKLGSAQQLSDESKQLWKQLHPTLDKIKQFRDIRNCAFHFGDYLEEPDTLESMYDEINMYNLDSTNEMLRALYSMGQQLEADAMAAITKIQQIV
jgi:hypothetical protein